MMSQLLLLAVLLCISHLSALHTQSTIDIDHLQHSPSQRSILSELEIDVSDSSSLPSPSENSVDSPGGAYECMQLPHSLCINTHIETADKSPEGLISLYTFDYPSHLGIDTGNALNHLHAQNYALGPGVPVSSAGAGAGSESYSALFDGHSWATIPHLHEFSANELTFSFWLFVSETGYTGFRSVLHKGGDIDSDVTHMSVGVWPESTKLRVKMLSKDDGETLVLDSVSSLQLGSWTHVALSIEGPFLELQINGVVDSSLREESGFDLGIGPILLGNTDENGNGNGFIGYLDQLKIFQRALTKYERMSVQSFVFSGMLVDFVVFGCESCSLQEAVGACSSVSKKGYHLCNAMELDLGALVVARAMGWIVPDESLRLWSGSSEEDEYTSAQALCCRD